MECVTPQQLLHFGTVNSNTKYTIASQYGARILTHSYSLLTESIIDVKFAHISYLIQIQLIEIFYIYQHVKFNHTHQLRRLSPKE